MRMGIFITIAGLVLLAGCNRPVEVGYRVTVTVDDNGTLHTGSGVWRVAMRGGGFPNEYTSTFHGEAIPVDLGTKGTVYVLIAGRDDQGNPTSTDDLELYGRHLFGEVARITRGEKAKGLNPLEQMEELRTMTGQTALLDCAHPPTKYTSCPLMVRFRDEKNPMSVEAVDPLDFAATFGPSVALKPIKVQLSDEAVTAGIAKRFEWWNEYLSKHFDGSPMGIEDLKTRDIRARMNSREFSSETAK